MSLETYLADLQGPKAIRERITVDDLDVLMLRNDPSQDSGAHAWARSAGVIFGRALNKVYFHDFPRRSGRKR